MSRLPQLYSWRELISNMMPTLSVPQSNGLADWSFAIALTRSCSSTLISQFYARLFNQDKETALKRLREWYLPQARKKGDKRVCLEVTQCFPLLLRWLIKLWDSDKIALAMDATHLKDVFTILSISVVYRGCAIPVAWKVLKAHTAHRWNPEWITLLEQMRKEIPGRFTVILMSDRGLFSPEVFNYACRIGWHPFMRIRSSFTFKPIGGKWTTIRDLVPEPGQPWGSLGGAFKSTQRLSKRLACTLLILWDGEEKEPWCILTDLPVKYCNASWYAMRSWIEHGFKKIKSGGLQWGQTRIEEPDRASRIWLAMAVAMMWLISIGGKVEDLLIPTIKKTKKTAINIAKHTRGTSLFRNGWIELICALILREDLPKMVMFKHEPWPRLQTKERASPKNLPL